MAVALNKRQTGPWSGGGTLAFGMCLFVLGWVLPCPQAWGAAIEPCHVNASPAEVDYAPTTKSGLHIDPRDPSVLSFDERIVTVTTSCDAFAELMLTFRDQQGGIDHFRFGEQGYLDIQLLSAHLDGQSVGLRWHAGQGGQPDKIIQASDTLALHPGDSLSLETGTQTNLPHLLIIQLKITPVVPREALSASDTISPRSTISVEFSRH